MKTKPLNFTKKELDLLKANHTFQKDIRIIRKKYAIPTLGIEKKAKEDANLVRYLQKNTTARKIKSDIDALLRKYNLAPYFRDYIFDYLGTNDFDFGEPRGIKVSTKKDPNGNTRIFIEIFADTTTKDIQKNWHIIEKAQKEANGFVSGRRRTYQNFERDKRVYELVCNKLPLKEITEIIKEEFGRKKLDYEEVHKIASRFRGHLDKK